MPMSNNLRTFISLLTTCKNRDNIELFEGVSDLAHDLLSPSELTELTNMIQFEVTAVRPVAAPAAAVAPKKVQKDGWLEFYLAPGMSKPVKCNGCKFMIQSNQPFWLHNKEDGSKARFHAKDENCFKSLPLTPSDLSYLETFKNNNWKK